MQINIGRTTWLAAASISAAAFTITTIGDTASQAVAQSTVAADAALDDQLANTCRADVLNEIARQLGGVTIKGIANGPKFADGVNFVPAKGVVPAHCRITGSFVTNPKTGKTANFLATLPANWNGKFLQLGCGGHCGAIIGVINDAGDPTNVGSQQGSPLQAVIRGYASFGTDQGHAGMSASSWAIKGPGQVDQDAIDDWLYRADQVLARSGKQLTQAFYARVNGRDAPIKRAYFAGCSGGGRDAMVAASYFPEEFDGVVAGSPYLSTSIAFQAAGFQLASIRSAAAEVPASLMPLFDKAVKAQCDMADGVRDGLIQNPMACNFRPERDLPRCSPKETGGQCFTPTQIETLSAAITAATDEQGRIVQPGYSVSELQDQFNWSKRPADLSTPRPFVETGTTDHSMGIMGDAQLRVFTHKNDPNFVTRSLFKFGAGGRGPIKDYRIQVPSDEVELARTTLQPGFPSSPEGLANFIRQNRKLLLWVNLSDQLLTPYHTVNYYKKLAALHGGYARLQNNARMFLMPGTAHCSLGGVGPTNFDPLTALENWVEQDKAPNALRAAQFDRKDFMLFSGKFDMSKPVRTMPLCKFPEMARYKGSGNLADAANWSCPAGDRSMLRMGESGRRAGVIK